MNKSLKSTPPPPLYPLRVKKGYSTNPVGESVWSPSGFFVCKKGESRLCLSHTQNQRRNDLMDDYMRIILGLKDKKIIPDEHWLGN